MGLVEPGDISDLLKSGQFEEGIELEAKLASGGFPRDAWKTISAFANTIGGALVLGLEEIGLDWNIVGVSSSSQIVQDLHSALRDRQKISADVCGHTDVWTESLDGKDVIVVRVRAAARRNQPVFLNGNRDLAFLRRDQNDHQCSPEELDRMRREAMPTSYDAMILEDFSLDDLDIPTIQRYRGMSETARPHLGHHALDDKAFLVASRAWGRSRSTGGEGPTVAGMLMFGKELSIAEIRNSHVIDYRREPHTTTYKVRWADRLRFTGNLFTAWEEIYPRLVKSLPVPFQLRGPQRRDVPAGEASIREAFVNLLVHTDYRETGDSLILDRDDGYFFSNPGLSWVSVEDLGVENPPERRNPCLAQLFQNAGLTEQAGSGFITIKSEWGELGRTPPVVESDPNRYRFDLTLPIAGLIPDEDRRWLVHLGGPWTVPEELALLFAKHEQSVDNATLRAASNQHLFDASQTLRSLRNRDLLVLQGSGRNTHYVLGPAAFLGEGPTDTDSVVVRGDGLLDEGDHKPGEPDHKGPEGDHKPGEPDHKGPEGDHKPGEPDHKGPEGDHSAPSLAYLHRDRLLHVISPLRETRRAPSSEEMQATILQLCAIEPLSIAQLADLFQRSEVTIRRYVQGLQRERRLARAETVPGQRAARYVTVPSPGARQQRLELPQTE